MWRMEVHVVELDLSIYTKYLLSQLTLSIVPFRRVMMMNDRLSLSPPMLVRDRAILLFFSRGRVCVAVASPLLCAGIQQ